MRAAMKQAMHWWMDTIGIDGFRCDVAGEVPTDFWNEVMAELRVKHPNMFTLAEDEAEAQDLTETAFDMYYGWELHHIMNGVAQGKKTVDDLWGYFAKVDTTLRKEAIRMNFTSNHDENSWSGTEFERMGDAANLFAAFTYVVPGMPMIYTGQPSGNHHRLAFFEKDLIDRVENAPQHNMYKQLNALRADNFALWSNEIGAPMVRLTEDNHNIFACVRHAVCPKSGKENTVIAVMNMSAEEQVVNVALDQYAGEYNCLCGKTMTLQANQEFTLQPWQHMILTK
jgi:glycosidase